MKGIKLISVLLAFVCLVTLCFSGCSEPTTESTPNNHTVNSTPYEDLNEIPEFSGEPYVVINKNLPTFGDEVTTKSFENYSELDELGRCGVATACIGVDIMPTEERGEIGQVKPTGWHTVKYDFVDGKYLYNRCHLIGFQLTGENANKKNLITGTRYFNVDGMLPFENLVADYVKETENHVMYRVTPLYEGDDLVARGVYMEGYSVEDEGEGVMFNVFVYNNQPGVVIDYATGESRLDDETNQNNSSANDNTKQEYVLNTNSKKIHKPNCSSVSDMNPANKQTVTQTKEYLINAGYSPCGICKP